MNRAQWPEEGLDQGNAGAPAPHALDPPYASALNTALRKLTNEVLVFLIAYTILLIGLATLGTALATELRTLLYVIPVLGVLAYMWQQKRKVTRHARDAGVDVRSGVALDGARVVGVRGAPSGDTSSVSVASGMASGGANVIGVDAPGASGTADLTYLTTLFEQMGPVERRKLVEAAHELLSRRASRQV
jgi:hypothetical protein